MRRHGTRTKYCHDECRCAPCTEASRVYNAANTAARKAGEVDLVDAAPVRAWLLELSDFGIGYKHTAQLAGVSVTSASKILYGQTRRCRSWTALALLAVQPVYENLQDGAKVDASTTWEHVRFLHEELGYPKAWIARHIGQERALQLGRQTVTKRNAEAIHQLRRQVGLLRYDERSMTVEDESSLTWKIAGLITPAGSPRPTAGSRLDAPVPSR